MEAVAGLHEIPSGAFNIRANGESAARNTTANIDIVSKEDVSASCHHQTISDKSHSHSSHSEGSSGSPVKVCGLGIDFH